MNYFCLKLVVSGAVAGRYENQRGPQLQYKDKGK